MKKEEIKKLLEEVLTANNQRRNEIHCILGEETAGYNKEKGYYEANSRGGGLSVLLNAIFAEFSRRQDPKLLAPTLLIMEMLCGEIGGLLLIPPDFDSYLKNI